MDAVEFGLMTRMEREVLIVLSVICLYRNSPMVIVCKLREYGGGG